MYGMNILLTNVSKWKVNEITQWSKINIQLFSRKLNEFNGKVNK